MSTLATRKQSKAIRDQMRCVRSELPYSMDDAREELKQLADWKYYVRTMPLTSITLTAFAAYLAVPHHRKPVRIVRHETQGTEEVAKPSIMASLIGTAAAMAMRGGTSLLLNQIGSAFSNRGTNHDVDHYRQFQRAAAESGRTNR